jgi:hypothetical protein
MYSKIGTGPSSAYVAEGYFFDNRVVPGETLNAERIDQNIISFLAYLDKQ